MTPTATRPIWADRVARLLRVSLVLYNTGGLDPTVFDLSTLTATNGVKPSGAPLPLEVAPIPVGGTATTDLLLSVPAAVTTFNISVTGLAYAADGRTFALPAQPLAVVVPA